MKSLKVFFPLIPVSYENTSTTLQLLKLRQFAFQLRLVRAMYVTFGRIRNSERGNK